MRRLVRMLKKIFILISGMLFLMMTTTACITVSTVKHERVDLETQGNRGYLLGEPRHTQEEVKDETREVIQIDVDLTDFLKFKEKEDEETEEEAEPESSVERNKGFVETKELQIEEPGELLFESKTEYEDEIKEEETFKKKTTYTTYTVKKNESLWDIAGKPQIYGDPTKWTLIYEANKDKIKKPNLIKAGMKLKIPH